MEDLDAPFVRVPSADDMTDETFIMHLEKRHDENLSLKFLDEPDRKAKGLPRRLNSTGQVWRTYHRKLHEKYDGRENGPYRHTHKEPDDA